jgi:predicted NAD/FAD-dependent oxidoreductase
VQNETPTKLKVAIIGAGITGLCAARLLHDQGHTVQVFEKARGPGGRTATRRSNDYAFDHGAQYFTVKDQRFSAYVASWLNAGIVGPWQGRIASITRGIVTLKSNDIDRYVGMPGMSAMARHLGQAVPIHYQTRVLNLNRVGHCWRLTDDTGQELGDFDVVLITTPPLQAVPLLKMLPTLAQQVGLIKMAPCWAVMAVFHAPLASSFDGAFVHDEPLSWIARNSSKPERPSHEAWVLHSCPTWSAAHLDWEAGDVADFLLDNFFQTTGLAPSQPLFLQAHRWLYSLAENPLSEGCLWDDEYAIGVCGDWCHGSRIEGAFLSGLAGAERVLSWAAPCSVITGCMDIGSDIARAQASANGKKLH